MNKKIIFVFIMLIFMLTACNQKIQKKSCNDFKDCLPNSINPGETGCGGCYPDGDTEICYEWDKRLCDSYMQNYSCVNGFCKNS